MSPDPRVPVSEGKISDFRNDILKLSVGEPARIFYVHRLPLISSSAFARTAMKSEWGNMREDPNMMTLKDSDPMDVELYVHWLYYKTLPTKSDGKPTRQEVSRLIEAYALGEQLLDSGFKNTIINALIAIFTHDNRFERCYPDAPDLITMCNSTPRSSPLRKLVVDAYAYVAHDDPEKCWANIVKNSPREFLEDVTAEFIKRQKPNENVRPWIMSPQAYLEQEENNESSSPTPCLDLSSGTKE